MTWRSRQIKFATLARKYIHSDMYQVLKYRFRSKRDARIECWIGELEGPCEPTVDGRLPDGSPDFDALLAMVPGEGGEVLARRFRDGVTLREMSRLSGQTYYDVRAIQEDALRRLRVMLAEAG